MRRSQVPSASAHSVEKETSQGSNTNVSLLDDTSRSVESNLNPARLGMSQVGDSVMTAEQSTGIAELFDHGDLILIVLL